MLIRGHTDNLRRDLLDKTNANRQWLNFMIYVAKRREEAVSYSFWDMECGGVGPGMDYGTCSVTHKLIDKIQDILLYISNLIAGIPKPPEGVDYKSEMQKTTSLLISDLTELRRHTQAVDYLKSNKPFSPINEEQYVEVRDELDDNIDPEDEKHRQLLALFKCAEEYAPDTLGEI
jgi:hypothetical protein